MILCEICFISSSDRSTTLPLTVNRLERSFTNNFIEFAVFEIFPYKFPKPIIVILSLITFCTFVLRFQDQHQQIDSLEEIRIWAKEDIWNISSKKNGKELSDSTSLNSSDERSEQTDGHGIIGVRRVYSSSLRGVELSAYLISPCTSLCGSGAECTQMCQKLIEDWEGPITGSKLLLEVEDQSQKVKRIALSSVGPIELIFWSKKQRLIAIKQQSDIHCCTQLLLFEVDDEALIFKAKLDLGPFSEQLINGEPTVEFRDIDDDGDLEVLAPITRFAHLTPNPLYVKMVYHLRDHKLEAAPNLLKANIPEKTELRTWLIQFKKRQASLNEFFSEAIVYCLKGSCDISDELIHLKHPQNENVQEYWEQLKLYLEER